MEQNFQKLMEPPSDCFLTNKFVSISTYLQNACYLYWELKMLSTLLRMLTKLLLLYMAMCSTD